MTDGARSWRSLARLGRENATTPWRGAASAFMPICAAHLERHFLGPPRARRRSQSLSRRWLRGPAPRLGSPLASAGRLLNLPAAATTTGAAGQHAATACAGLFASAFMSIGAPRPRSGSLERGPARSGTLMGPSAPKLLPPTAFRG